MLRILIIDDHALVREGLMRTMQGLEGEVRCVGANDAAEALELLQSEEYDLVTLDLIMPGLSGMAFLGVLHNRFPLLPVVIVSALNDPDTMSRATQAGASGFVSKQCFGENLLDALRQVLSGAISLPMAPRDTQGDICSVSERYGITKGQMRVLELLGHGKTNRGIADLLGVTEGTVKVHVCAIFKALKVANRAQALLLFNNLMPVRRNAKVSQSGR